MIILVTMTSKVDLCRRESEKKFESTISPGPLQKFVARFRLVPSKISAISPGAFKIFCTISPCPLDIQKYLHLVLPYSNTRFHDFGMTCGPGICYLPRNSEIRESPLDIAELSPIP